MILAAPLTGWSASLDEAPDPVFSGRLLGDGLLIDPTVSVLHAPCDGEIASVAEARHAVTLRASEGAEILLHVGIDTVGLGGEGFESLVRTGDRVRAGTPLLRFDLDYLAVRAKSLLTPIIVTDGARFRVARRRGDGPVRVGDFLLELAPCEKAAETGMADSADEIVRTARVTYAHGIHARPAALLVNALKHHGATVTLTAHGRTANARSAVALMALGARYGQEVEIRARGPAAEAAARALEAALGAADAEPAEQSPRSATIAPPSRASAGASDLPGIVACRGTAVGPAVQLVRPERQVAEQGDGAAKETAALERARQSVGARLRELAERDRGAGRDIMLAHLELLDDPDIAASAREWIAQGKSAGYAWRRAIRSYADVLARLDDERMAARGDDLLDLENSVLLALEGTVGGDAALNVPDGAVLLARDLLPSQLAALDVRRISGIALAEGGPTSHVAILAAAMGLPMIVAAGPRVLQVPDGTQVVVDAEAAVLRIAPDEAVMERARRDVAARRERQAAERAEAARECRMKDGTRIEIFANVGSSAEAEAAVQSGAEGAGLLRTEFLFLGRPSPPDEAEQLREYQRIVDAFGSRPVTVRTLDIGGDKPIPYLPLPREANPALGLRGVRTSLWRPDLLRVQLRALLRVRAAQLRILLPMVANVGEVRAVHTLLDELRTGLPEAPRPPLGAMVETPAAALCAAEIGSLAEFLSIGTNDLTQYTLAMDRGHPELAAGFDGLHPAVLRLIGTTAEAASVRQRPLAVCGGLAADPLAAPILIGLGVRELSVVPAAIPALKSLVRTLTLDHCRALAREALKQESPEAVRALANRSHPRIIA